MKSMITAVLGAICLAAGASADQDYGRSGLYAGAGALAAIETFDAGGFSNGGGLDLRVGYRFSPHISLEGLYEYVDGLDAGTGGTRLKASGWMLGIGPKAFLLDGSIQPYFSVGLGLLNIELEVTSASGTAVLKETDVVVRPALGVDIYLTEHLFLDLEAAYVVPTNELAGFDFITLVGGVQIRF